MAAFPSSFAFVTASAVVAFSIASVALAASSATFAFAAAFCSGVKSGFASIAFVAFLAASSIAFLASALSTLSKSLDASASFSFNALILACTLKASSSPALSPLANKSLAAFLAASISAFNFSTASL